MDGAAEPARHRLDVHAYHRMAEAGIFGEDDRIELVEGDLIDMAPIGQDHAAAVCGLTEALVIALDRRAIVSPQNPVQLDAFSEPQPDIAVLKRRADFYRSGERAGPGDVLLLIEVADSSLRFDREVKLPLYARAGIPEIWIVDLKTRVLEAYRRPEHGIYAETSSHGPADSVALHAASDIVISLRNVFG